MNKGDFKALCERARGEGKEKFSVCISRRRSADLLTPVGAFLRVHKKGDFGFLFESVEGGEKLARYSFIGTNPKEVIETDGDSVVLRDLRSETSKNLEGDIFDVLQKWIGLYPELDQANLPTFTGGAVGYLGYDTIRLVEELKNVPIKDVEIPLGIWCIFDLILAFDHVKHQVVLMSTVLVDPTSDLDSLFERAGSELDQLEKRLIEGVISIRSDTIIDDSELASNISKEQFMTSVETAKNHIYNGDIFQVVLSQRFEIGFEGEAFNLYRSLRQVNPSPYLYFFDFGSFEVAGSSPEVLIRVIDGRAEVLPIAGTRPRGASEEEDQKLAEELLADPKERAEHVMLVDLGRNDLGRTCEIGSVQVTDYAYIERYSHVMHIVSSVEGRLREDLSSIDALAAAFPAGTVSGAPKVRAMEIIDDLEPTNRGLYAGAVGYIDRTGNLDTCIAIRTMLIKDHKIYVQAGAGIVADSQPELEFEETLNKARALKEAILQASKGLI